MAGGVGVRAEGLGLSESLEWLEARVGRANARSDRAASAVMGAAEGGRRRRRERRSRMRRFARAPLSRVAFDPSGRPTRRVAHYFVFALLFEFDLRGVRRPGRGLPVARDDLELVHLHRVLVPSGSRDAELDVVQMNVHTWSQNRYVSRFPLLLVFVRTSCSASFMHLSNCASTLIAIEGVSSPFVTISSSASVSDMPSVELR